MTSRITKSIFILLTCATLLAALTGCVAKPKVAGPWIVGSWHGNYYGYNARMYFGDNGEFSMNYQGGLITGTYTINTSVKPNQLDILMENADVVTTIARLEEDGTFTFENNLPTADRPTSFTDFIVFTRDTPDNRIGTSHPVWTTTPAP